MRTVSSATAGTNVVLADSEDLYVAPGVAVAAGTTAVQAAFDHHAIMVAGSLFGQTYGILLGTNAAKANDIETDIWIGAGGSVTGGSVGILSAGAGITVTNEGTVFGADSGLRHLGNGLVMANLGTISGDDEAAHVTGTATVIDNHGVMTSTGGYGIYAMEDTTLPDNGSSSITVVNYGTISGQSGAFRAIAVGEAEVFTSRVFNHGTIEGVIDFADGNDLYDGHDGAGAEVWGSTGDDTMIGGDARDVLNGEGNADSLEGGGGNDLLVGGTEADELDGGDGDDVLRPGAGRDFADGGAGTHDMLDYFGSAAVVVNLASGDASGGDAQGDVFLNFEWLAGGNAADVLTGDTGANRLVGRLGNDNLSGAAGNDVLIGDAGNDTLNGGTGFDVLRGGGGVDAFRFATATDSGGPGRLRDRIMDFTQADDDRIDVSAIDANAVLAGAQDFSFIGSAAFTDAGQVRAQVISGNTFVSGNTDANLATSEFSIFLSGSITLTNGDFLL